MQSTSLNSLQPNLSFLNKLSTHKFFPFQLKNPNNSLRIQSSTTTPTTILKTTLQKTAILLAGGLIFMANFGFPKPSLANLQSLPKKSNLSQTMEENKDLDEDIMYMELLERNPRDVDTLKIVVTRKMSKGETNEGLKYVQRLIQVEPEEVEWRLLEALCYEMIGQLSKAKSLFRKILRERPLLLRALHGLAMVMHKNLEGPAVFEMLDKALDLARRENRVTEERNIKILTAQMHVVKGELGDGLKKFHDLIDENPRDFRPYLCQGIIYSLMDRKKEAEEQFETYRSLVPQEFPQRGFLDDVVLSARTESREQLAKEIDSQFSYKK
ncbi:hypothetical protein ACHQM5_016651 [Ranunculus cassubicifolius]